MKDSGSWPTEEGLSEHLGELKANSRIPGPQDALLIALWREMKLMTGRQEPVETGPEDHAKESGEIYHEGKSTCMLSAWRTPDAKRRLAFDVQDWRLLVYSRLCTPGPDT